MKWLPLSILLLFSLSGEEGLLTQAESAYQRGDFSTSVSLYEEALREFPEKSSQIRFNLAQ
ncbi:MAG: hypothetical protein AAFQ87_18295, partial [Bacteroidota bacterium]